LVDKSEEYGYEKSVQLCSSFCSLLKYTNPEVAYVDVIFSSLRFYRFQNGLLRPITLIPLDPPNKYEIFFNKRSEKGIRCKRKPY